MMKRETFAIATIYVPVKRRATLDPKKAQEIAESILQVDLQSPILVRQDGERFVRPGGRAASSGGVQAPASAALRGRVRRSSLNGMACSSAPSPRQWSAPSRQARVENWGPRGVLNRSAEFCKFFQEYITNCSNRSLARGAAVPAGHTWGIARRK
jgi:hypothetical protein